MIDALPLLLSPEGYQISRSVRLRSSASAYFNRTPASAGNRKTWTWSGWVKRGTLGATNRIFTADDGSASTDQDYNTLFFTSSDQIKFAGNLTDFRTTTAVYRDPSAWYHIVFATDTTQATAANRFKLYVNGVEVTAFGTSNNPSQNTDLAVNAAIAHYIGSISPAGASYFDGYQAEINFIDGQALTPSSFGENDTVTGVWKPKKYAGTYGTNGFYLNFSDNSAATAAAIGKDYSGNGNNWTPNNISVTSGSTYDSMLDVPTPWADGGNGRGNYAVLNPLGNSASGTLSNANLQHTRTFAYIQASIPVSTGQWYWEVTLNALGSAGLELGILGQLFNGSNTIGGSAVGYGYDPKLGRRWAAAVSTSGQTTSTVNDVIGFAFDASALTLQVFKNNTSLFTITGITAGEYYATCNGAGSSGTDTVTYNFGQRPFAYTPPTGFKALNTQNLPEPTIKKGGSYFDVVLYTGDAVQDRAVTGFGFDLDLAWIKSRNNAGSHVLVNRVVGGDKQLFSNLTNAEQTNADVTNGFTTGGILLGDNVSGTGSTNQNTYTYALWGWKEGATQGFDIVTYTGTGSAQNISHSLGVAPRMMIVKKRSTTGNWPVYHASLGNATSPFLNLTNAANSQPNLWNSTTPTSSVFTVGSDNETNASAATYVAYLFSEVAGFSRFGSYTGNGSTDGPFVFCGFRPRFIMFKRTDSSASWRIIDTAREAVNATQNEIYPNLSNAEAGAANGMDILSNGFKLRGSYAEWNASGGTYVFAAFAESPFKNSLAR